VGVSCRCRRQKGVPGRVDDSYGIGWARTQISGAFLPFLSKRFNLGLDRENTLETHYNLALMGGWT